MTQHDECLRRFGNFVKAFVTSISGSAIKRDALMKHMQAHSHANRGFREWVTGILHTMAKLHFD